MTRPFYTHETWQTAWYWRLGRLGLSVYKPCYQHWHWGLSDSDGGYGLFTPYFTVSWVPPALKEP